MKVPYFNQTNKPVTLGSVTIMPGACRDVDESLLKPATKAPKAAEPAEFDAAELLKLSVSKLEPMLVDMTDKQLHDLKGIEEQDDKPRKSLLEAFDGELLSRAM